MKASTPVWTTTATTLLAHIPCCGPTIAAALGAGSAGAGWLHSLEAYRPYILAFAFVQLAVGFYLAYRPVRACHQCASCAADASGLTDTGAAEAQHHEALRRNRIIAMWVVAAVVTLVTLWPQAGHTH